jgi:hypothetical protein
MGVVVGADAATSAVAATDEPGVAEGDPELADEIEIPITAAPVAAAVIAPAISFLPVCK